MNIRFVLLIVIALSMGACAGLNDPYYNDGGYYNRGYDYNDRYSRGDYYDYQRDRERDRYREARRDAERERRELERERERLERERKEREAQKYRPNPPVYSKPKPDRCPPGWSPGGKCSNKERKRGCQDMRTPGGLACVKK